LDGQRRDRLRRLVAECTAMLPAARGRPRRRRPQPPLRRAEGVAATGSAARHRARRPDRARPVAVTRSAASGPAGRTHAAGARRPGAARPRHRSRRGHAGRRPGRGEDRDPRPRGPDGSSSAPDRPSGHRRRARARGPGDLLRRVADYSHQSGSPLTSAPASTTATTRVASTSRSPGARWSSSSARGRRGSPPDHACGLVQRRSAHHAVGDAAGSAFQGVHAPTVHWSTPQEQRHLQRHLQRHSSE
jgi:hypothetical protein